MIVVSNRIFLKPPVAQVFLYSLANSSLVFYAFLALWFNVTPIYSKFLTFINREFSGVGMKAPTYYFSVTIAKQFAYSSILVLPDNTKKAFIFGAHFLSLNSFDLFKLSFWYVNRLCWFEFRKCFSAFSIEILLHLGKWLSG